MGNTDETSPSPSFDEGIKRSRIKKAGRESQIPDTLECYECW
jgi:hypothetical protein